MKPRVKPFQYSKHIVYWMNSILKNVKNLCSEYNLVTLVWIYVNSLHSLLLGKYAIFYSSIGYLSEEGF